MTHAKAFENTGGEKCTVVKRISKDLNNNHSFILKFYHAARCCQIKQVLVTTLRCTASKTAYAAAYTARLLFLQ